MAYPNIKTGFQGSETSWVEATFYRHGKDPVVVTPDNPLKTTGRRSQDEYPCLIAASTNKAMGVPSGTFSLRLKPSQVTSKLFDQLIDDDWVDIVVYKHDQPWHVMRGLLDDIRRSRVVGGSGATITTYDIIGRDFAKIWEITPIWFSPWANDLVTNSVANKVMKVNPITLGHPGKAVQAYLEAFLEEITSRKGPNWEPPAGMPGVDNTSFINNITFQTETPYFKNIPKRRLHNPNFLNPRGTLWGLAQQYSDPAFTEFYADLLPEGGNPFANTISAGDPISPKDSYMTVVLRDKPFPVTDVILTMGIDYSDNWKDLPIIIVPREQIIAENIGRGGFERFNAFFAASTLHQEKMGAEAAYVLAPLIDINEIKRHGVRRMDVQCATTPEPGELDDAYLADYQRRMMKDWYLLNPYFYNGTFSLGIGRPDAKIGCRMRVPPGNNLNGVEENYYIEQVSHDWSFGSAVKTSIGVTRGWHGTDDDYMKALKDREFEYKVPEFKIDE